MPETDHNAHPDNFANADLDEAVGRLVRIVRAERPQVIITYSNEQGGYSHPDHIRVHEISVVAFERAGDPEWYPEAGEPWQPLKLYYSGGFSRARIQAMHDWFIEQRGGEPVRRVDRALARGPRRQPPPPASTSGSSSRSDARRSSRTAPRSRATDSGSACRSRWRSSELHPWEDYELARSLVDRARPRGRVRDRSVRGLRGGGKLLKRAAAPRWIRAFRARRRALRCHRRHSRFALRTNGRPTSTSSSRGLRCSAPSACRRRWTENPMPRRGSTTTPSSWNATCGCRVAHQSRVVSAPRQPRRRRRGRGRGTSEWRWSRSWSWSASAVRPSRSSAARTIRRRRPRSRSRDRRSPGRRRNRRAPRTSVTAASNAVDDATAHDHHDDGGHDAHPPRRNVEAPPEQPVATDPPVIVPPPIDPATTTVPTTEPTTTTAGPRPGLATRPPPHRRDARAGARDLGNAVLPLALTGAPHDQQVAGRRGEVT